MNKVKITDVNVTESSNLSSHLRIRDPLNPRSSSACIVLQSNSSFVHKLSKILVLCQLLWALAIPFFSFYPVRWIQVFPDSIVSIPESYRGIQQNHDTNNETIFPNYTGQQVIENLQQMLNLTLNRSDIFSKFHNLNDFAVYEILNVLSIEEHEIVATYLSLFHQASEYPAGKYLQQEQTIQILQNDGNLQNITYICRSNNTLLHGMKCTVPMKANTPCGSSFSPPRQYDPVNLTNISANTGWGNSIALSSLISTFHRILLQSFRTLSWKTVVDQLWPLKDYYNENLLLNGSLPNAGINLTMLLNRTIVYSCVSTELIYTELLMKHELFQWIESEFLKANIFNVIPLIPTSTLTTKWNTILNETIQITSGVQFLQRNMKTSSFADYWNLTTTVNTTASFKPFYPLNDLQKIGDISAMYIKMFQNNGTHSFVSNNTLSNDEIELEISLLGSFLSGIGSFKQDDREMSMETFRLRELPLNTSKNNSQLMKLYQQQYDYQQWYENFEQTNESALWKIADKYFIDNTTDHRCLSGLIRRCAQVLIGLTLDKWPMANYLMYQATNIKEIINQMKLDSLLTQNSRGDSVRFNVNYKNEPVGTNAWPMIILFDIVNNYTNTLNNRILESYIKTNSYIYFTRISESEFDKYNLGFADHCALKSKVSSTSFQTNFVSLFTDIQRAVEKIRQQMANDVGPIGIRPEYLAPVGDQSSDTGSNFYLEYNFISIAMQMLLSHRPTSNETFLEMAKYEVCYEVLDFRFLNVSTRCFIDLGAITTTRVHKQDNNLGRYVTALQGFGIIFSVLTPWIVLMFIRRIYKVFKQTYFSDLSLLSAFNLSIQGGGMLTLPEIALFVISYMPALLDHHLPHHSDFIVASTERYYLPREFIIALGLSWVIQLGTVVGGHLMYLKHRNMLFDFANQQYRHSLLLLVLLIRRNFELSEQDYTIGLNQLLISLLIAFGSGFFVVLFSKVFDYFHTPQAFDAIDYLLLEDKISRSVYCTTGKFGKNWNLTDMLLDGWILQEMNNKRLILYRHIETILRLHTTKSDEGLLIKYDFREHKNRTIVIAPIKQKMSQEATSIMPLPPLEDYNKERVNSLHPELPGVHVLENASVKMVYPKSSRQFGKYTLLGKFLIFVQLLWAVIIPFKNVYVIPWPYTADDSIETYQNAYIGYNNDTMKFYTGDEVMKIFKSTINITFDNIANFRKFDIANGFIIDQILETSTTEEHKIISEFISLLHQASEFPAGRFLANDYAIRINSTEKNITNHQLICLDEDKYLSGVLCTNSTGGQCVDGTITKYNQTSYSWSQNVSQNYTFVNFTTLYNDTGLKNNYIFNELILDFYRLIDLCFRTKDWNLINWVDNDVYQLSNGTIVLQNEWKIGLDQSNLNDAQILYSCSTSELLYMNAILKPILGYWLQTELISRGLFHASELITKPPTYAKEWNYLLQERIYITSGAMFLNFTRVKKSINSLTLTDTQTSSSSLKYFRSFDSATAPALGSNRNLLQYMFIYNNTYGLSQITTNDTAMHLKLYMTGNFFSGMKTFKDDWWGNTMHMTKLREMTTAENASIFKPLIEKENQYVEWFRNFEYNQTNNNSISKMLQKAFKQNATDQYCHLLFLRKFTQILWLVTIDIDPFTGTTPYIPYSAYDTIGYPMISSLEYMKKDELVLQNSLGHFFTMPFENAGANDTRDGATAWVYIPLLYSLLPNMTLIRNKFYTYASPYFMQLVNVNNGRLDFGGNQTCNVSGLGVTKSDSKSQIFLKLNSMMSKFLADTFSIITPIYQQMQNDLGDVSFPPEYFIKRTYWNQTVMGLGITKLLSRNEPLQAQVSKLVNYEQCYLFMENRYLNTSVRCFLDYPSVTDYRKSKFSNNLRIFYASNFALGVSLNVISMFVVLQFARHLVKIYRTTGFNDVNISISLDLGIQGARSLSLGGILTMAISAIPSLIGYHLPLNSDYVIPSPSDYSRWMIQIIIALSLTWYLLIGIEIASYVIRLRVLNLWYIVVESRCRYLVLIIVFLIRNYTFTSYDDYSTGIWLLVITCLATSVIGFLMAVIAAFLDKVPEKLDSIEAFFLEMKLSRSVECRMAQTSDGWHISGFLFEKWQLLRYKLNRFILVKNGKYFLCIDKNLSSTENSIKESVSPTKIQAITENVNNTMDVQSNEKSKESSAKKNATKYMDAVIVQAWFY